MADSIAKLLQTAIASIASVGGAAVAGISKVGTVDFVTVASGVYAIYAGHYNGATLATINTLDWATLTASGSASTLTGVNRLSTSWGFSDAYYTAFGFKAIENKVEWATSAVSTTGASFGKEAVASITDPTADVGWSLRDSTHAYKFARSTLTYTYVASALMTDNTWYPAASRVSSSHGVVGGARLTTKAHKLTFATESMAAVAVTTVDGFRISCAGVSEDVALYYVGGNIAAASTAAYRYDVPTDTISTLAATLPAAKRVVQCMADNGTNALFLGGDNGAGTFKSDAHLLDFVTESISAQPSADATLTGWWNGASDTGL